MKIKQIISLFAAAAIALSAAPVFADTPEVDAGGGYQLLAQTTGEVYVYVGETYTFINNGVSGYNMSCSWGGTIAVYDSVGSYLDSYYTKPESNRPSFVVPSGGKAVFTLYEKPDEWSDYAYFNLPEDGSISAEKTDTPALNRSSGLLKTYTYKNITNSAVKFHAFITSKNWEPEDRYYYVLKDANGNIISYEFDTYSSSIDIPAGSSITVTSQYAPLEFAGAYEAFEVTEQDEPAIDRVYINPGESYTLTNIGGRAYTVLGMDYGTDYLLYDADGNLLETSADTGADYSAPILSGWSIRIVNTITSNAGNYYRNSDLVFGYLHGVFEAVKDDTPLVQNVNCNTSHIFTNIGNTDAVITASNTWSIYFTVICYDENGEETDSYIRSDGRMVVPSGCSVRITSTDNRTVSLFGEFDIIAEEDPYDYIALSRTEQITLTNISGSEQMLEIPSQATVYEIIDEDGNAVENKGTYYTEIGSGGRFTIPDKYTVRFGMSYDYEFTVPHGVFDITLPDTEMKTYKLTNTGVSAAAFKISAGYIAAKYSADDKLTEYYTFGRDEYDHFNTNSIERGGYALVSISADEIGEDGPDIDFSGTIEEVEEPAFSITQFEKGDTYKFTNNTAFGRELLGTGKADYAIYDANGNLRYGSYGRNVSVGKSSVDTDYWNNSIPAGGCIYVTSEYNTGFSLYVPYSEFTVEKVDESVYSSAVVDGGEAYEFINNSDSDSASIEVENVDTLGLYDYVIYGDEILNNLSPNGYNRSGGSITIDGNRSIAFMQGTGSSVVYWLNRDTTANKLGGPVSRRINLDAGTTITLVNNLDRESYVGDVYDKGFESVTYQADGTPVDGIPWSIGWIPAGGKK